MNKKQLIQKIASTMNQSKADVVDTIVGIQTFPGTSEQTSSKTVTPAASILLLSN